MVLVQDPTRAALGLSGGTRNLSHIQTLLAFEPGDWDIELMEDGGRVRSG